MMQDEKSIVDWCTKNLCHGPNDRSDKKICRFFWHITNFDHGHAYECEPILGTRYLHYIRSTYHTN
jgi:hypothetical protein